MCDRCTELQLAISKGRKLAKTRLDAETRRQALYFVETLSVELAALRQRQDHRDASGASGRDVPDKAGTP